MVEGSDSRALKQLIRQKETILDGVHFELAVVRDEEGTTVIVAARDTCPGMTGENFWMGKLNDSP